MDNTKPQKPTEKKLSRGGANTLSFIIIIITTLIILASCFWVLLLGTPAANGTRSPLINYILTIALGIVLPIFIAAKLLGKINDVAAPKQGNNVSSATTDNTTKIFKGILTLFLFALCLIIITLFIAFFLS